MSNYGAIAVRDQAAAATPTPEQLKAMAKDLALTGMYADSRDPRQAYAKVLLGQALGLDPASAMAGILLNRGRMSMTANLMAMLIKRSPKYRFKVLEHTNEKCKIAFFERVEATTKDGKPTLEWDECGPPVEFTIKDAATAGLATGDNWKRYPKNMLYARAISNGAKWYCADVFGGSPVYLPDEIPGSGVKVNPETLEVESVSADAVIDGEIEQIEQSEAGPPPTEPTPAKASASSAAKAKTPAKESEISRLIRETGTDEAAFVKNFAGCATAADLKGEQLAKAVEILRLKKSAPPLGEPIK